VPEVAATSPVAIPGIAILLAAIAAYLPSIIDGQPWTIMGCTVPDRV
jgi:hypothetical protein